MPIHDVYDEIRKILDKSRIHTYYAVNFIMVQAYWNVGKIIVEEEQKGKIRANYGDYLIKELSKKLMNDYKKGFTEANLRNMRQFFLTFPKRYALRSELSWTHFRHVMRVENKNARNFYMIECANNKWSTRELDRQINSMLYERLALSKDKRSVLELSKQGQIIENASDLIKDPYILEFLDLDESERYSESDLEEKIINNLKKFILELGRGFMFVERQKRITLDDKQFYIDLVFYNRILRCFVLIELKLGELTHKDLGQLQMYVHYYDREIKTIIESPTIGILLCSDKNKKVVRYTLPLDNKQIFASKYRLYLPSEKELIKLLE